MGERAKRVGAVLLAPLGLRTLVLVAVAAALLAIDWPAARALGFGLGLVAAVLAFVHWWRKTQHPYVDFEPLVQKAQQDPIGAAIVIASFVGLMVAVLFFVLLVVIR